MEEKITICLVDDEPNVTSPLRLALEAEGYEVRIYEDGVEALRGLTDQPADFGIFDIKMPKMDGVELLRHVRQSSDMPVIFLAGEVDEKIDEIEAILGLENGADDYIAKPFWLELVVARVKAVQRRYRISRNGVSKVAGAARIVQHGKLVLDLARYTCRWDSKPVRLTLTEFLILQELADRSGMVKSREVLVAACGKQEDIDERAIDKHIKRMRKKFTSVDEAFDLVETVYGLGYRLKET